MKRLLWLIALAFILPVSAHAGVLNGVLSGNGSSSGGGGGGSGTVNNGTAGQSAYYGTTGTVVSGSPLQIFGTNLVTNTAQTVINNTGASAPTPRTGSVLQVVGTGSPFNRIEMDGIANPGAVTIVRTDGSVASPTALVTGDEIGGFNWGGYNGTAYVTGIGAVSMKAGGNWTATSTPTYIDFLTTPVGTSAGVVGATLQSTGILQENFGINNAGNETIAGTLSAGATSVSSFTNSGTATLSSLAGSGGFASIGTTGQIGVSSANAVAGQIYGFPNLRAKLANYKQSNSGVTRICFDGDSTFFGSWSTANGTGDLNSYSMPSQLATTLQTQYGIKNANRNGFIGDQGIYETFGANDPRIVLGGFAQDSSVISIGGRTFKTTAVAGTPLTFTPTTPVTTFRFLYVIQSGGGTLQAQIDSETAVTYNTAGTAGVGVATLSSTNTTAASHTIKFTMSAGTQVNFIGVSDAYDNNYPSVDIVNAGWPGAKAADWSGSNTGYGPSSPSAYAALACDASFLEDGINDWNAALAVGTFQTQYQTWITGVIGGGGDVALVTPFPSPVGNASIALQNSYVAATYALAATNKIPVEDMFTHWQSNAQATLFNLQSSGSAIHPNAAGYGDEAQALAATIANVPGQLNNGVYTAPINISQGVNTLAGLSIVGNNQYGSQFYLVNTSSGGHSITVSSGGSSFPGYFYAYDNTSAANVFGATTTAFNLSGGSAFGFTSSTTIALQAADTGISRLSAGKIGFGTGAVGNTSGTIVAANVGIGTNAPGTTLDVSGGTRSSGMYEGTVQTIASAATITPTAPIVNISGTVTISTATPPSGMDASHGGCFDAYASGAWSTNTTGNIATTMTAVSGTEYRWCYWGTQWTVK